MPWEVTIVNASDPHKPLGERNDVITKFTLALPTVSLQQPPKPPKEVFEKLPPVIRETIIRPKLTANFEANNISIQFYTNDESLIKSLGVEVRGNGNPIPIFAALCIPNGWAVLSAEDGKLINLSVNNSPDWEQFRIWRDKAIQSLSN